MKADAEPGYSRLSLMAHWIAAIFIVALFLTHEGGRGSAERIFHVSGGAILGVFLLWRVWHRVRAGFAAPSGQAWLLNAVSQAVLWGFLAAIVVVVITGYLLPWSVGRPLDLFGIVAIPSPMQASLGLHGFLEELHEIAGDLFLPLLALHLLGAAKHWLIDRDGVTQRMFRAVSGGR